MPTYGYRCPSCASDFEVWQRMTDEARADCPSCGAAGKRLFFPTGIVFKGGGFYKTDSRGTEGAGTPTKPAAEASGAPETGKEAAKSAAADSVPGSPPAASPAASPKGPAAAPKPPSPSPSAPSGGSPPGKSA